MFEEHDLVRASATECMCNLVLSTEVTFLCLTPKCIMQCENTMTLQQRAVFSGAELVPGHGQRSAEAACALQRRR